MMFDVEMDWNLVMTRQIAFLMVCGSLIILSPTRILANTAAMGVHKALAQIELAVDGNMTAEQEIPVPTASTETIVKGRLMQPGGKPAAYVLVCCGKRRSWTDAQGRFELRDIAPGKRELICTSPMYQAQSQRIFVEQKKQIITSITMIPKDAYKPAFSGPIGTGVITWLATSIDAPFKMNVDKVPAKDELAKKLSFVMAPGQIQSKAVAFFANRHLTKLLTTIRCDAISSRDLAKHIRVRWVKRTLDRLHNFNHSRLAARFEWRFLWNRPPENVRQGDVHMLVITIHLPTDAAAGIYHGTLNLGANGKIIKKLPLTLSVLGFHLAKPRKRLGIYYPYHHFKSDWTSLELKDIRSHGGSILVDALPSPLIEMDGNGQVNINTTDIKAAIQLLRRYGFTPPYMVPLPVDQMYRLARTRLRKQSVERAGQKAGNYEYIAESKPFMRIDRAVIDALNKLQRSLKTGPLIIYWMDEIFDSHRLPKWLAMAKATRPLTNDQIYVTLYTGYRTEKMMDEVSPYVNIRCYHGGMIDWWLANTTKQLAKTNWPVPHDKNWWLTARGHSFSELANSLRQNHAQAWVYYNQMDIHSRPQECERLINGYWLWRSPFTASVPWCYRIYGSPFNAMASRWLNFGFAFHDPKAHELVGTLGWEAYRQGYNDLCYLATLERAIKRASAGTQAVRLAQHWLERIRTSRPETATGMAMALSPHDLTLRRAQMAHMIEALIRKP